MSWFSAARTRLHLLFARRASESRMNEELAFHIDMRRSGSYASNACRPTKLVVAPSRPSAALRSTPNRCAMDAVSRGWAE